MGGGLGTTQTVLLLLWTSVGGPSTQWPASSGPSEQAGRVTWRSPRPAHNPPAPSLSGSRTSLLSSIPRWTEDHWQADCLLIIYHIPKSWCPSPDPRPAENKTCPALDRARRACEVRLPDLGWHLWASEQTTTKAICSQATYSLFPKTEQNKT